MHKYQSPENACLCFPIKRKKRSIQCACFSGSISHDRGEHVTLLEVKLNLHCIETSYSPFFLIVELIGAVDVSRHLHKEP